MSAPLTPEQRETLNTVLGYHAAKAFEYREGLDDAMAAKHRRAVDALRAALSQPARTCGRCQHFKALTPDAVRGFCEIFTDGRTPDDGCLLGWRARETETPTT